METGEQLEELRQKVKALRSLAACTTYDWLRLHRSLLRQYEMSTIVHEHAQEVREDTEAVMDD